MYRASLRWRLSRRNACHSPRALGLGAQVTILDISAKRLSVPRRYSIKSRPTMSNLSISKPSVRGRCVLEPSSFQVQKAPKLVTDDMVKQRASRLCHWAANRLTKACRETADRVTTPGLSMKNTVSSTMQLLISLGPWPALLPSP